MIRVAIERGEHGQKGKNEPPLAPTPCVQSLILFCTCNLRVSHQFLQSILVGVVHQKLWGSPTEVGLFLWLGV